MREIKFRAWDKNAYKMAEVTQIIFSKVQHTLVKYRYKTDNGKVKDEASHIDEKGHGTIVLLQYTGLKDRTGTEIYEGDIVEAWSEGSKHVGEVRKRIDGLYIIYPAYHNGFWGLKPNEAGETTVEVIGNKYENKELLEVE